MNKSQKLTEKNRRDLINRILADLKSLNDSSSLSPEKERKYAIKENIKFFQAIRFYPSYFFWLLFRAPFIAKNKLLELTDFGFGNWEKEFYPVLLAGEKKSFSAIKLLVNTITEFILQKNLKIIMDIGSGGMEAELQIIKKINGRNPHKIIFIGIDHSQIAHESAEKNLKEISEFISIRKAKNINQELIDRILSENGAQYIILLSTQDIFKLGENFKENSVDLIFHSRFKHHLKNDEKNLIDDISKKLSKVIIEHDNYSSWFSLLLHPRLEIWQYPVSLNGAIFSRLRNYQKQELMRQKEEKNSEINFLENNSYLKIIQKKS